MLGATTFAAPMASAADPAYGFGRKPQRSGGLPARAHAAHFLADADDYTEYWSHAFLFKSGHVLYARFLITNLGPGDNKGAVAGHLITPDGTVHELVDGRREPGSFTYSQESLSYQLAGHSLSGDGTTFSLKLSNDAGSVQVSFTNVVPSYRPGKIRYGADKASFLEFSVTSPRANAKGTFNIGGVSLESDGFGYADHFYTNFAQQKQVLTWLTVAGTAGDYGINLTHLTTTPQFRKRRLMFFAVSKGSELAGTSNNVTLSQSRAFTDKKSKARYRVNRRYRIAYRDKASGDTLVAKLKVKRRLHRFDVLRGLAPIERFIVERFTKPIQYRMLADLEISGKVGGREVKESGEALIEVVKVNKD